MALRIRMARGGTKKRPYYRIVIADSRAPRDGRFIEKIGHFNPLLPKDSEQRVGVDLERAKYWLGVGATPTDRVGRFLGNAGIYEWKASNNPQKAKQRKKAQERLDEASQSEEDAKTASETTPVEESAEATA